VFVVPCGAPRHQVGDRPRRSGRRLPRQRPAALAGVSLVMLRLAPGLGPVDRAPAHLPERRQTRTRSLGPRSAGPTTRGHQRSPEDDSWTGNAQRCRSHGRSGADSSHLTLASSVELDPQRPPDC
jgi:hypothetical protein